VTLPCEGTWGINFPLIINDLRPQKTTSSKEVAQCQAQALAKCLVWSSTPGWQRTQFQKKPDTAASGSGLAWDLRAVSPVQNVLHRWLAEVKIN
jgi:hypothetical protein